MSFEIMGLADETLRAVTEAGYETPTPIQKQAIPVVLQGRDVMGIAQTGTGKTAGFTLPMIDILSQGRARARMPRSLILEPTRELAAQVAESFETYGKYHKLSMALLIGGVSFEDQNKKLDRGVDVLIATPGRLLDHFERGRLMMSGVEILVVDEADRMLDMGFIPDIERICKMMPQRHQTLFFSATMPSEIKRLSDTFLDDPKQIEVAKPTSPAETVEQFLVNEKSKEAKSKRDTLRKLIDGEKIGSAIVFCNRKKDVDIVAKSLKKHGHNAAALHGDMDQMSRMKVLTAFKNDEITILCASDVAARGLDIPAVSHVFNFDVPNHAEDYIHRIGRTGRAGRSGRSFTIASPLDAKYLAAVQDMIGKKIPLFKVGQAETAEAPKIADAPKEEGQNKRRGRRRNSRNKADKDQQAPVEANTQATAEASPQPTPDQPVEANPAPVQPETQQPEAAQQPEQEKPARSRSRGGRRNRNGNGNGDNNAAKDASSSQNNRSEQNARPKQNARRNQHGDKMPEPNGIKGLGDHTPAFLLQPVIFPGTKNKEEEAEEKPKAKAKAAPKKRVRKKAPAKKTPAKKDAVVEAKVEDETIVVETVAVEAPVTEAPAEIVAEAPVVAEKPKRKRAPRKRKTVAEKAAELAAKEAAAADVAAPETADAAAEPAPEAPAAEEKVVATVVVETQTDSAVVTPTTPETPTES
jgi:superfamily II DNA/RNA helicase